MTTAVDVSAAGDFLATHARVLDRRRFELRNGQADPAAVLDALDAYRNPHGGYGWGLEPDLRSPESQPGAAHHAFEVFEEIAPATAARAVELCDWLGSITLGDGGLPMALPMRTSAGSGPWWSTADPSESSLQITSVVAAAAQRVAVHDPAVAAHPWLERATDYCMAAIDTMQEEPAAYVLGFSLRLLDAVFDRRAESAVLLGKLAEHVPDDGRIRVTGGAEDEMLRPLDISPYPDSATRKLFSADVIESDLERLAGQQQEDGGWIVDFVSASPAGALDWRGYATVRAIDVLRANGAEVNARGGPTRRT
jgi:hypothetical protein